MSRRYYFHLSAPGPLRALCLLVIAALVLVLAGIGAVTVAGWAW